MSTAESLSFAIGRPQREPVLADSSGDITASFHLLGRFPAKPNPMYELIASNQTLCKRAVCVFRAVCAFLRVYDSAMRWG